MSWRYEGGDANEAILIMLMWCGPGIGGTRGPGMEVAGEHWTGLYGTGWEGPSPAPSLPSTDI